MSVFDTEINQVSGRLGWLPKVPQGAESGQTQVCLIPKVGRGPAPTLPIWGGLLLSPLHLYVILSISVLWVSWPRLSLLRAGGQACSCWNAQGPGETTLK